MMACCYINVPPPGAVCAGPVSDSDPAALTSVDACYRDHCPPMLEFKLSWEGLKGAQRACHEEFDYTGVIAGDGNTLGRLSAAPLR